MTEHTYSEDMGAGYPPSLVWTSPSRDATGSMPLGNGDIAINIWVEESGDVVFYIAKSDTWDENGSLLKLGRIRLTLAPNPIARGVPFRQTLRMDEGAIIIEGGGPEGGITLRAWVDANRPAVRLEIISVRLVTARVALELWRTVEREKTQAESHAPIGLRSPEDRERVYPDTVVPVAGNAVVWCHRNLSSCWAATLELQDMAAWIPNGRDPLLGRTFGALLCGEGLVKESASILRTATPQSRIVISAHPLTAQTPTLEAWVEKVMAQAARSDAVALDVAYAEHVAWWRAFWDRSVVRITGSSEAEAVSLAYNLQRFVTACAGRGAYPVKFNGSLFTVESTEPDEPFDADYRRWGGGYWFQNTRLIYWPMLMAGDFEMMHPLFRMYQEALPLAKARTRLYFGHEGAFFPETMTFWGTYLNCNYGFDRKGRKPGEVACDYIRYYWSGALELLALMLDYVAYTGDDAFGRRDVLILARPVLQFYREHYPKQDDEGRIVFKPAQSLETWHEAVNPLPDIAGLRWVLDGLLAFPWLSDDDRATWERQRQSLPPLPSRALPFSQSRYLLPALQYDLCRNSENPELYAVFPFRIFGLGKENIETARNTFEKRTFKGTGGWRQDAIQAALLGLTDESRRAVAQIAAARNSRHRFPAFWGPNFNWIPDQDHGNVLLIAVQRMLLQGEAAEIRILPAWPREWDVEFRLHAPRQTTIEGQVAAGRLVSLRITPECRWSEMRIVTHMENG